MKQKINWYRVGDYITFFLPWILALLLIAGCGTIKEVPVQTIEKVVVKDSVVYVNDTITIEIEKEKIVEVVPADTVSQIATSLAFSEAKIEKGMLHHSLEQKGQIKVKIDTFYVTQIKEVEKLVEVPIEVIKEVKYIPEWAWYSVIFNVIVLCFIAFKIYLKFKK
jgi:uncharacterized protein YcfL